MLSSKAFILLAVKLSFCFTYFFEDVPLCPGIFCALFYLYHKLERDFNFVNFLYPKATACEAKWFVICKLCPLDRCCKVSFSSAVLERHRFMKRAQALAPWLSPNMFYGAGDRNSKLSSYQLNPLLQQGETMAIISEGNRDEKQVASSGSSALRL